MGAAPARTFSLRRRPGFGQPKQRLTFIVPRGLTSIPFDSRLCWTPWSVFQDGSGGPPIHRRERPLAGPPRSLPRPLPFRAAAGRRPDPRGVGPTSPARPSGTGTGARGVLLDAGELNPRRRASWRGGARAMHCFMPGPLMSISRMPPPRTRPPARGLNPLSFDLHGSTRLRF